MLLRIKWSIRILTPSVDRWSFHVDPVSGQSVRPAQAAFRARCKHFARDLQLDEKAGFAAVEAPWRTEPEVHHSSPPEHMMCRRGHIWGPSMKQLVDLVDFFLLPPIMEE